MPTRFPTVTQSRVLAKSDEWIEVDPTETYRRITVRLWGKGVMQRDEISGVKISAKKQRVAHAQQFILSRIDARNGAFGLVPDALDGAIVSSDFPVFTIDVSRIVPEFLEWMSKSRGYVNLCKLASEGTTNRVRLQEDRFLRAEIPVPPLEEQRNIVSQLEKLSAKIKEAKDLHSSLTTQLAALLPAEERKIWPESSLRDSKTLEEVTLFLERGRCSDQGPSSHYLVKTQHVQMGHYVDTNLTLAPHAANKVKTEAILRPGDILIACSAAGCLGRVAYFDREGLRASTDTHVAIARPNPDIVLPRYLYVYLRGARGQHQLRSREKGDWTREKIGFRLIELNVADMKRVSVPVPPREVQRRIVEYLDSLEHKMRRVNRNEAIAGLEVLLQSVLDRIFGSELTENDRVTLGN